MIKVSGEEYGIEENALPADAKEIQKQKQAIDDELKDIEAKQKSKKQPISSSRKAFPTGRKPKMTSSSKKI